MKNALIGLLLLVVAYWIGSPYWVVHQIQSAAQAKDAQALAAHIDFVSVRQNLKDQLNNKMTATVEQHTNNPFALLGTAFAGLLVDKMVDVYVTPTGMQKLMSGQFPQLPHSSSTPDDAKSTDSADSKPDVQMSYQSLNSFVVTSTSAQGHPIQAVLTRQGLTWKVTNIVLPLDQPTN